METSGRSLFRAGAACVLFALGCSRGPEPPSPSAFTTFADVTVESGIDFEHDNGHDGKHWRVVETVNGGVGLIDFDADGLVDVYFTNGAPLSPRTPPPRNALYRNLGGWRFEEATERSGTGDTSLSLGVAVADVDGDGLEDLYVTNLGPNRLYRNRGDGTFEDIAERLGVAQESMDTGCAFFDMDRDGDLDLYVASYVLREKEGYPPAVVRGVPGYWPPLNYEGAPDHLYRNEGDRFRDVSEEAGLREVPAARGLGVIAGDFDGDGDPDVYVANDLGPNYMFLNDGRGRFTEAAFFSGAALGPEGEPLGSMGVDVADYDGDGLFDLAVTNYQGEINNLYRRLRSGDYEERADVDGIARNVLLEVSWGVGFFDFDHDGDEDLFIASGHLNPYTSKLHPATSFEQENRVYSNLGGGRFEDMSDRAGAALRRRDVSRGAAFGDLDNDGDIDIVVLNAAGRPQILRNDLPPERSWVLVGLEGTGRNRSAIGAQVRIQAAGMTLLRERRSSASYLSANDPRLHFGLGDAARIERLEVRWPNGETEVHEGLPVRVLLKVRQGAKAPEPVPLVRASP